MGQKAKYSLRADVFRFGPESGLSFAIAPCPKSAINGSRACTSHQARIWMQEGSLLSSHAACSKTPVNHSGSLIITGWPDVVFSKTVQELSALHSPNALSNAANGYLGKRM